MVFSTIVYDLIYSTRKTNSGGFATRWLALSINYVYPYLALAIKYSGRFIILHSEIIFTNMWAIFCNRTAMKFIYRVIRYMNNM